ncbi:MAG TPA: hypothetical protein PLB25_02890 [Rhodoferax sp.]|nr:hypothetical protein [Rhodoferax sp.]
MHPLELLTTRLAALRLLARSSPHRRRTSQLAASCKAQPCHKAGLPKPDQLESNSLRRGGATATEHLKYFEFVGVTPARRMTLWLS